MNCRITAWFCMSGRRIAKNYESQSHCDPLFATAQWFTLRADYGRLKPVPYDFVRSCVVLGFGLLRRSTSCVPGVIPAVLSQGSGLAGTKNFKF